MSITFYVAKLRILDKFLPPCLKYTQKINKSKQIGDKTDSKFTPRWLVQRQLFFLLSYHPELSKLLIRF